MKKPSLSLLALFSIVPILAGGCTLYSNSSACEAQMRREAAVALPTGTLSVVHVGVGIRGSRVVVEGTLKTPAPAHPASGAAAASPALASASASASAPAPASAPISKPALISKPAAVECMFNGDKLTTLHWFSPPELANPPAAPATDG